MGRRRRFELAQDKIIRLSMSGLDVVAFWRACTPVLADAVPHYLAPCCFTLDPASRLITSHYQEGLPEFPSEWLAAEYADDDVNQIIEVANSITGISTLYDATGGEPSRSPRWHANMQYGGDQELIAVLRTRRGEGWGALGLYREIDRPLFDQVELAFLAATSPALADGVRRGLLVGEDPEGPEAPGVLVLDHDWSARSWSASAEHWLGELPGGDWSPARLPPVVRAVAGRASRGDAGPDETLARVVTRSRRWLTVHGTALATGAERRVAVIMEPGQPARIAPLLMSAYGLTDREQALTRLVLQGHSTAEIAETLAISPLTVQQHLKSVFDKTGVRSRRDLLGKVFFAHYEPRFRDNELRAAADRPLRGGPMLPVRGSQRGTLEQ